MSTNKKSHIDLLMIIPDGVSWRNFVYSSFLDECKKEQLQVGILNLSGFEMQLEGVSVYTIPQKKLHVLTTVLKNVRKQLELHQFTTQFHNTIYQRYLFKARTRDVKSFVRLLLTQLCYAWYAKCSNILTLRRHITNLEQLTPYHKACMSLLKQLQPTLVYTCSQRSVQAIAPIQAAKKLDIPTVGFIYSWDNLPKATLDVETDRYQVWSDHMKTELLQYHSFIMPGQIMVTGTPQFEFHFNKHLKQDRTAFLRNYDLDPTKKYLCFSGDDVTTSPHDPQYLEDVAKVVRILNQEQDNWRIIFRRCPVDFSNRYDQVLQDYATEITPIAPKWQRLANSWDAVLPLQEDNALLLNTVAHCELVINLGSSMVFDAACQGTPCAYISYNPEGMPLQKDVHTIYKYIHFQTMPKEAPVFWLREQLDLKSVLLNLANNQQSVLKHAKEWFETINYYHSTKASQNILNKLQTILSNEG
jgi:hypothetical protein